MERNKVVLVTEEDAPLEEMDKLEAHQKGILHRAFSVFIFNEKGEMLLQQRAAHKYHGAHLWTNACCSHPQWEEDILESAKERLLYEMGLNCNLQPAFTFRYQAPVENELIEHELDHVFIGTTHEQPAPNPDEVQDYAWVPMDALKAKMKEQPDAFTFWFKMALSLWDKQLIPDESLELLQPAQK